jgi:6-pyruvoyltetrahydropterin/6-carboxytetrahydropterin synthase
MGTFELTLEADFAAAHRLRMYDGRFEPLHGHNWHVEVSYEGRRLDRIGVVADFTELQDRLRQVVAPLHDRCLNDLPTFARRNPSAENVARHICDALAPKAPRGVRLSRVRVWEAPGCSAAYGGRRRPHPRRRS